MTCIGTESLYNRQSKVLLKNEIDEVSTKRYVVKIKLNNVLQNTYNMNDYEHIMQTIRDVPLTAEQQAVVYTNVY